MFIAENKTNTCLNAARFEEHSLKKINNTNISISIRSNYDGFLGCARHLDAIRNFDSQLFETIYRWRPAEWRNSMRC